MTKTKRTGGMILGNIIHWVMCIFLTTFTIWRGSIQRNESWNQRIYWMELWNVADACQCDHSCSCILSGKILHWCGDHYQYGICRIHCGLYLLCSE